MQTTNNIRNIWQDEQAAIHQLNEEFLFVCFKGQNFLAQ